MDLDRQDEAVIIKTPGRYTHASTPAKHTVIGGRLALSPSKINTHFKTSKAASGMYLCLVKHVRISSDAVENTKDSQIQTPQTPRHRDALSKKIPVTPRHRVTPIGKPWTPRPPRTPGTPGTPGTSLPTVYNTARQLFVRSTNSGRVVGRDEERNELNTFIQTHLASKSGGCLYVSGPPGTGKSALANETCADLAPVESVRVAYINCMSMKSSRDIYAKLVEHLWGDTVSAAGADMKLLEELFVAKINGPDLFVVTLDEIDHLLTLDLDILYTLFEWSLQRSSRLILIGIANALDLTDRFLPRLKARNLKPQLLPFLPYTASQIDAVLTTRLRSLLPADGSAQAGYVPFVHPAAISLCSRKVASQTGDLRKAFDMSRRAIDLIEGETKQKYRLQADEKMMPPSPSKTPLTENANLSSPSSGQSPTQSPAKGAQSVGRDDRLLALTAETAPRATVAHIGRIAATAFGNGTSQRLQALNVQQKAALCSLVALEKRKRAAMSNVLATPSKSDRAAPTVRMLYETYTLLCKRDGMLHPLSSTEFRDVISSLETLSLVTAVEGKTGSFAVTITPSKKSKTRGFGAGNADEKRLASCVAEKELVQVVDGVGGGILRGLLNGEGLD